jgi:hypothetical protein
LLFDNGTAVTLLLLAGGGVSGCIKSTFV